MISELLPEDKRRLSELDQQLAELERVNTAIQVSDISLGLQEMNIRLEELDKIASRESKSHRDDYKRRVASLRNTHNHIRSSLEAYMRRKGISMHEMNRAELFGNTDIEVGAKDEDIAEHSSLSQSERMVREYIAVGQSALGELVSQRDRLKNVQRKVLDILNYLGLSNSIMRMVEGRDRVDSILVMSGAALIMLLLFCIWYFRR
jgi:Golgi SNAP receptor complex protein 2